MFEMLSSSMIMFNAFVVAAEIQFIGLDMGARLDYPKLYCVNLHTQFFENFGTFFGIYFTVEVTVKFFGWGPYRFAIDPWSWVDLLPCGNMGCR